eukprot:COSAG02_NODE_21156_length_799_cov_4.642857_1_plen_179_part_10
MPKSAHLFLNNSPVALTFQQFTGFYRRGDAGQYQCIPVVCDKSRGLYWLYYAIGKSRADIVHQVKQMESNGTDVRRMIKDGALMVVHDYDTLAVASEQSSHPSSSSGGDLRVIDVSDGIDAVLVGMSEDQADDLPDPILGQAAASPLMRSSSMVELIPFSLHLFCRKASIATSLMLAME